MTNTKNILIAQRYADALTQSAQEGKLTFDKISADLNLIKETLISSKDLAQALINPVISPESKKEIIEKVFAGDVDTLIINFLKILVDKGRFDAFDEIIEAYNKSLDNINNISRIKVTSAVAMTDEAKKKLINKLEEKLNKKVILDLNINADIIAGLVIEIGDNIIDTSLKHKLEDLSKSITR